MFSYSIKIENLKLSLLAKIKIQQLGTVPWLQCLQSIWSFENIRRKPLLFLLKVLTLIIIFSLIRYFGTLNKTVLELFSY